MGFLKKYGASFLGNAPATSKHHGFPANKAFRNRGAEPRGSKIPDTGAVTTADLDDATRRYRDEMARVAAETRRKIQEDQRRMFPRGALDIDVVGESLHDVYRDELYQEAMADQEARRQWIERERTAHDPLLRFLAGEEVSVVSSNVATIKYDRKNKHLYIVFKKNMALYRYYDVSEREAEQLFRCNSPGSFVWDVLRVRGSTFAWKKDYDFVSISTSGYAPRYTARQTWLSEHAAIPQAGTIPETWLTSGEPYDLAWLVRANPGQFPKAKILRRKGKGGDGKEPIGKWLGSF